MHTMYQTKLRSSKPKGQNHCHIEHRASSDVAVCHRIPKQLLSVLFFCQRWCRTFAGIEWLTLQFTTPRRMGWDGLVYDHHQYAVNKHGWDWDTHLLYLLIMYRMSVQDSTKEGLFLLFYGRDPILTTETALSYQMTPYQEDISNYQTEKSRCNHTICAKGQSIPFSEEC